MSCWVEKRVTDGKRGRHRAGAAGRKRVGGICQPGSRFPGRCPRPRPQGQPRAFAWKEGGKRPRAGREPVPPFSRTRAVRAVPGSGSRTRQKGGSFRRAGRVPPGSFRRCPRIREGNGGSQAAGNQAGFDKNRQTRPAPSLKGLSASRAVKIFLPGKKVFPFPLDPR